MKTEKIIENAFIPRWWNPLCLVTAAVAPIIGTAFGIIAGIIVGLFKGLEMGLEKTMEILHDINESI